MALLKMLPSIDSERIEVRAPCGDSGPMIRRYQEAGCRADVVPMPSGVHRVRRDQKAVQFSRAPRFPAGLAATASRAAAAR